MKVASILYDGRIKAHNILFDYTIGEYLDAIRDVVAKNPFQRKRIVSSKSVYTLLRQDILEGCVIPPIVLALSRMPTATVDFENTENVLSLVRENEPHLLILDGLQRTHTLLDLEEGLEEAAKNSLRQHKLRVEVYIGIDRLSILYRMLTLNTGQTPMSLRQQIEMLYLDYLDTGIEGVHFVREVDEERATNTLELNFRDTVEGFNSYINRDENPLDKGDLIDNIKSLHNLSHETSSHDLFREFVIAWVALVNRVTYLCGNAILSAENSEDLDLSWGKTAPQVFKKSQVVTGFGAALGKLKDFRLIDDLSTFLPVIQTVELGAVSPEELLQGINKSLSWIKINSKKIGSSQRSYFQYFFRELFNSETDSYLNLAASDAAAIHKVQTQI
jgi:hypothetical protein